MNSLQDQHVLILGLGASGLAMARWCARCGAQVTVADTRAAPPQLQALQRDVPDARFVSGAFDAALVEGTGVRAVFKSPGLSPAEVAIVLSAAGALGVWVAGELGLFSQALNDLATTQGYQPQVLAVTGTNGKTTVTSLTGPTDQPGGQDSRRGGQYRPDFARHPERATR
jgi:UDP-N-acetylmuramoylalanine--D-glutamate ligase